MGFIETRTTKINKVESANNFILLFVLISGFILNNPSKYRLFGRSNIMGARYKIIKNSIK
jgi:hypothetical protein